MKTYWVRLRRGQREILEQWKATDETDLSDQIIQHNGVLIESVEVLGGTEEEMAAELLKKGRSIQDAIKIYCDNASLGVKSEYFLLNHIFGQRRISFQRVQQALIEEDGRWYDQISVSLPDGNREEYFFDAALFFGNIFEPNTDMMKYICTNCEHKFEIEPTEPKRCPQCQWTSSVKPEGKQAETGNSVDATLPVIPVVNSHPFPKQVEASRLRMFSWSNPIGKLIRILLFVWVLAFGLHNLCAYLLRTFWMFEILKWKALILSSTVSGKLWFLLVPNVWWPCIALMVFLCVNKGEKQYHPWILWMALIVPPLLTAFWIFFGEGFYPVKITESGAIYIRMIPFF